MNNRIGQQVGNYRLTRLLGQGGFAEVYLGTHVYFNEQVALKLLHGQLSPQDIQNFIQEAKTIKALSHPHIVPIRDAGMERMMPYIVMDYAPNGTLRNRYPRGAVVPLSDILSYVSPIASALQHAHDQRLIHRDVKPENILLGPNNEVWLSDFGITSVAHSTRSLDTEKPGGTVPYMAPEQLRGKARPASDQYALGVIVYEWLCGERPFGGTATEIAMQHVLESPPSLREKMPMISPHVEQVVMRALAKDPMQRFDTVQTFATALEQASRVDQPHSSILSQPLTVPGQPLQPLIIASPAMPLSQQTTASSPVEGVQTLPTPPDQPRQVVSSSRLQNRPEPVRQNLSRRAILLGLSVAGLAMVTSGLTWLLSPRPPHPTSGTWYNGNYLYKKSITIDHTKVSSGSDLRNFPVLISLTDLHLKTSVNRGYVQNSSGYDIIFVDSTETKKLDHEIEKYVATTGEIEMWVRIPVLSASKDTIIRMYFGNSSITSSQENKSSVWDSNYKGVWHLNESSGKILDSTSNGNIGIPTSVTKNVAGEIANADAYDGTNSYTSFSGNSSLTVTSAHTVEAWINPANTSTTKNAFMILGNSNYALGISGSRAGGTLGKLRASFINNGIWYDTYSTGSVRQSSWQHIAWTMNNATNNWNWYLNGMASGNGTTSADLVDDGNTTMYFGTSIDMIDNVHYNGLLDEVRISNIVRSAGWIATEYNNQYSPSTFYTVSSLASR